MSVQFQLYITYGFNHTTQQIMLLQQEQQLYIIRHTATKQKVF